MKYLRTILLITILAAFLSIPASAQMPAPPVGFVHVDPPFEGVELIYTSPTIEAHNWFGNYRLDVLPGVVVPAPNALLDGSAHSDTIASAFTRGDLIVATAAGWDDLAIGGAGTVLGSDGTDASWVASGVAAHSILDGVVHTDSVVQVVTRGSLIVGDSTPNWNELVIGGAATVLTSDGTDASWAAPVVPTNALLDGSSHSDTLSRAPALGAMILGDATSDWTTLGIGGAGDVLTVSGGTAAWTDPTNALLDNANHTDTTASAVTRGDIIIGNSTPDWDDLAVGTAGQAVGTIDGTDVTYAMAPRSAFQLAESGLTGIDNTATSVAPVYMDIDGIDTGTNQGHNMTRAGSVTGIAVNSDSVAELPATADVARFDVYLNGTAIGLTVDLHAGAFEAQNTQAPNTDVFVAGDNLTVGAYYGAGGGPIAVINITNPIVWFEVIFD